MTPGVRRALLCGILGLAAGLRLPLLDRVPNGLIPDEALSSYDAYSIVRTGKDAYGERLPLFPRSTARLHCLNMYAVVPFVAARGLDEWAARLPAALAGVATVGLVFLLGRELYDPLAGLAAAGLLAVSPWHVLLSRTGYDWAWLPALTALSVWLLVRALARGRSVWPAGLAAGVSLYGYAPIRLLLPLLLAVVAATHWPELRREWRRAMPAALLLAALAAPVFVMTLTAEGQQRLSSVLAPGGGPWTAARAAAGRFAASFSPAFLLAPASGPELHRLKSVGLLYGFEAPLILLGAFACLTATNRRGRLPLLACALAPLAVCIHRDAPDPILGVVLLPWLPLLGGVGAAFVIARVATTPRLPSLLRRLGLAGAGAWVALSAGGMALDLYRDFPVYAAPVWSHGVGQVVRTLEPLRASYDDVLVNIDQKLVSSLILFYARYDPARRQQELLALPGRAERGEVGSYRLARLPRDARSPGRHLVWTTAARARGAFPDVRPFLSVPLPDGRADQVALAVVASEQPARPPD